jgi:predicted nucleic acid-binding protein
VLDTGPLGQNAHPKANPEIISLLRSWLNNGHEIVIPEIADHELRREFLRQDMDRSIEALDAWADTLTYLPCSTQHIRHAAWLWAETRKKGRPTAHSKSLDGDVIVSAQAVAVSGVILTVDPDDFEFLAEAYTWTTISGAALG